VTLDFVKAVRGTVIPLSLRAPCGQCDGTVKESDPIPCPNCHGSATEGPIIRTVHVRVPAGTSDGQRIQFKGKGAPGIAGGLDGDLRLLVHVRPHPVFGRVGDNLTIAAPVALEEAQLGTQVTVPTLTGAPVTLRVPAGSPPSRMFRVRGRGVQRKDGSIGDLLVEITVHMPPEAVARYNEELERSSTAGTGPAE
ncbi:molecular chaperone DnaJ, partial [Nonomuraea sp. RK-328]|nr:molecular chaperone DnaJ [Nonomuraea sp. RK-328]